MEIIAKCVLCKLGGFDRLTSQISRMIYAIVKTGNELDWSGVMYERLVEMVKSKDKLGYGMLVGELLRRKGVTMG